MGSTMDVKTTGKLTVLAGPMFAGKTEALIERALKIPAGVRRVYKPVTDTRQGDGYILSHGGVSIAAEWTDPALERIEFVPNLFVDEAQFLSDWAILKVQALVEAGTHITLSGLDLTSDSYPFGPMPAFLALANEVVKLTGHCAQCGRPSTRTFRKEGKPDASGILVGGAETYEPRCLPCFKA